MKNNINNKTRNKIKNSKKYVTIKEDGMDFRKMSTIMSEAGYKMNHATARNVFVFAMETLILSVADALKTKIKRNHIKSLTMNQNIHDDLADVICIAYNELLQEKNI